MRYSQAIELSERLLCALYAAPQHGELVCTGLDPGAFPPELRGSYEVFVSAGIRDGRLDYARVDNQVPREVLDTLRGSFSTDSIRFGKEWTLLEAWATELKEWSAKRNLAIEAGDISEGVIQEGTGQTIAEVASSFIDVASRYLEQSGPELYDTDTLADGLRDELQSWKAGESTDYQQSFLPGYDRSIGGFPRGEVTIFAGMTGGYKTGITVEINRRMLTNSDKATVIFSAEMNAQQMGHRFAALLSGHSTFKFRPRDGEAVDIPEETWADYEVAIAKMRKWKLFIDDDPEPTLDRIYAKVRQIQTQHEVGAVFIDYLEKVSVEGHDSEEQRVAKIALGCKTIAKRLKVPMIVLCQYSGRQDESNPVMPKNSWLRYSRKIAHEAAVIIHWHYPRYYIDNGLTEKKKWGNIMYNDVTPNDMYAVCGKNRFSHKGKPKFSINPVTGRLIDPSDPQSDEVIIDGEAPF